MLVYARAPKLTIGLVSQFASAALRATPATASMTLTIQSAAVPLTRAVDIDEEFARLVADTLLLVDA